VRPAKVLAGIDQRTEQTYHACLRINLKFDGLDQASEARIILPCILIVCIILWVVDVFLGSIGPEAFVSDCSISKSA